ncbi:MAG: GTP-binding protein, partial [Clostridiales bacterium]|nr:GTP-binding protein [Clostridiales bacterium]
MTGPHLVIGMLAHVDAGKTTLTEAMLYQSGFLKRLGRVDHRDAFLDHDELERKRGITIFAKQAVMTLGDMTLTLLDTPGHADFSTEAERTLQVLDYAILVINASDGVQGHTATLWKLLEAYAIPCFVFVNKTDLPGADPEKIITELKNKLHSGCVSFTNRDRRSLEEEVAMCGEAALAQFLEQGKVAGDMIGSLIAGRELFPCYFGAALRLEGVSALLEGLERYIRPPVYPSAFGAKVFKITRDPQNNRLTHFKITGGRLRVKAPITGAYPKGGEEGQWTEKTNQLRIYSGEKYRLAEELEAGEICAA